MSTQHYITGVGDKSLKALSEKYGVSGNAISKATFGGVGATLIYPWLRDNGGERQARAPAVPTGYHWSFAPGMVVNIPDPVMESLSPVSYYDQPAGPPRPGGPEVTVFYADSPVVGDTGAPSTGREDWNEEEEEVAETDPALVDPTTGEEVPPVPPPVKVAGFMGLSWTMWLILGVAAYLLMGEPKKKRKKRKRRTTRRRPTRRRRRRNYYRKYYDD